LASPTKVPAVSLIVVGVLMAQSLREIKWHEMEIAIPAFLILLGMPLTYSISDGIALGFIFYPITMLADPSAGKEIQKRRPGLVVSRYEFNRRTMFAVIC